MDKNRLGMILFIGAEATFFVLLILAYVYFRITPTPGPKASNQLDPLTTGIFSVFLYSSSFTVWRAEKSFKNGNPARMMVWLGITILFGLIFLSGQGLEWRKLILNGTTINTSLFGTTFFTLTGFHGLHVIVGLVMLSILLGLTWSGHFRNPESSSPQTISLYWHFVDAVWVVIYSTVYLALLL